MEKVLTMVENLAEDGKLAVENIGESMRYTSPKQVTKKQCRGVRYLAEPYIPRIIVPRNLLPFSLRTLSFFIRHSIVPSLGLA